MTWLESFASWVGDPTNISSIAPSAIVIVCTIALIITISVCARRLGTRIERAIANETPIRRVPQESRSDRRDRNVRPDRSEPVTGPLRTGNIPSGAPAAEPAPTPAPAHVNAPPQAAPLTPPPAAPPVVSTPAVASVAPPLPPSMMTPPPSAQAFARASALDNDPLNQ